MKDLDLEKLGQVLRALRGTRSQMDVEAETGVPQYLISRLERGDIEKPNFDYIIKLASAYGVTPNHLAAAAGAIPAPSQEWDEDNLSRPLAQAIRTIRSLGINLTESQQRDFAIRLDMAIDAQRRDFTSSQRESSDDGTLPSWLREAVRGR